MADRRTSSERYDRYNPTAKTIAEAEYVRREDAERGSQRLLAALLRMVDGARNVS